MNSGTLSVVQTLLEALQCSQLKDVCSILGYKSELDHLCDTVSAVKAMIHNAGALPEVPHEAQLLIQELKDVIYDADDLVDEFVTLSEQKQLIEDGKVSEEKIREKLDTVAHNDNKFGFSLEFLPIRRRREETRSYVGADNIVGREDDVFKILGMLPDSDDAHQGVKFLSIVGPGGLGKTALARLVYNHERVVSAFSLRLWTCVSDQDQKQFDVKEIFNQILRSCLQQMDDGPADQTQDRLMGQVAGRKFLLILDDVWTENLDQWLKLAEFFMAGRRGCWIVVTTRSRETTKIIGNGPVYELQGLSEENSWGLFEKMAFEQEIPPEDLVKIGRKIVERCAGVPLAVWVVGSLLHGQGKSKWLSIQEFGLADIRNSKNIMPLLKLSYSHLGSSLKSCFNYCALFPKGFEIEKEWLISLWMAQGFVVPLDETQSIEDAGEEYFSLLFQRCFFQDIQIDEYGEVVSCKINALMHDIAEESAGNEICVANPFTCNMDGKGHHLSVIRSKSAVNVFRKSQIRTYLQVGRVDQLSTEQLLENMTCLRSLVLKDSGIQSLPNSIDKLLHLRCLDLSDNVILEVLPESITNLHNLQTLVLRSCIRLKALPKDLSKLVKLRVLDVVACYRFTSIPSDLGKLTCLHTLTKFPVKASSSLKQCSDQLEGLKALKNLRGQLEIHIQLPKNLKYVKQGYMEVSYLRSKDRLNYIRFCIEHAESDASIAYEEAMLEDLQPHSNLRGLVLFGYHCVRMPELRLCKLPNLKAWHKKEVVGDYLRVGGIRKQTSLSSSFPCFPQLKLLHVQECPGMTSVLLCPKVEDLELYIFNRALQISVIRKSWDEKWEVTSSSCLSSSLSDAKILSLPKLRSLNTDNIEWYKSLPTEVFQCLTSICIYWGKELESLSQVEEVFHSCSSSLQTLIICHCPELRSLSEGLKHLTALETLVLEYIPNLFTSPESEEEDGMPWRSLDQCLRSLELRELPKLVNLPTGMQYLTNLRILRIWECEELHSLPAWLKKLTSLRQLDVRGCPQLYERCQNPDEEDWSNIQHIPHVSIN
uniref:Uncharacterized protein n=1 Tax=Chenopodium quinoa TaxID=63459 RepID=A0A803LRH3_CHEQI